MEKEITRDEFLYALSILKAYRKQCYKDLIDSDEIIEINQQIQREHENEKFNENAEKLFFYFPGVSNRLRNQVYNMYKYFGYDDCIKFKENLKIKDLGKLTEAEYMSMRGFGKDRLEELKILFVKSGMKLKRNI